MTRIVLFLSVLVLLAPAPGLAATYNWVGLDSDWDIKTNWDPNTILSRSERPSHHRQRP